MKRRIKKTWLTLSWLLALVLIIASIGGAAVAQEKSTRQPTTLEIESATVVVGSSGSVDVWVMGYPTVPDVTPYGLGAYTIRVDFDPLAVDVTGVSPGDSPYNSPIYTIYADYVSITQFHASWPGPDGDIRLCDLEFDCLALGETTFALTVITLADVDGDPVTHTPVDGIITQVAYEVEIAIAEEQDIADGVVILPVTVVRVVDPTTDETITGVSICSYRVVLSYTESFMEILDVRVGDPPFDSPPILTVIGPGSLKVDLDVYPNAIEPPVIIFNIVARLIDSCLVSDSLSVTVVEVSIPDGAIMSAQDLPMQLQFQRGDIRGNGVVDIIAAMYGAQYIVGVRPVEDIRQLNMASVKHGDVSGDKKDITDCMFIAQKVVGIRDAYFELVPPAP